MSPRALRRLWAACDAAKKALSSTNKVNVDVDAFYNGEDLALPLTRDTLERLCAGVLSKSMVSVQRVLKDAKLRAGERQCCVVAVLCSVLCSVCW